VKKQFIAAVILTILFVILNCFNISLVNALSCAPPVLDEMNIGESDVIFEGIAGSGRELTDKEISALNSEKITTKRGSVSDKKAYEITVVRAWKGVEIGDKILILRNAYWGDSFTQGENYFILSFKKIGNFYITPLCGHSVHINYAQALGFIKTLEEVIGK